jgi:superfamily II DNA/RNA helicase
MTRIIARELDAAGIRYEYLHGGIPSKDRKTLFDNFNNTQDCRVFLSTDAGSTGLNLQAASLIINMDIPWNPAVMEQRIARIHRMGQKGSVSVINFVSTNTIEHRMLGVLKFKTSLAQGILDGGEDAIFMEDSKFNVFMKEIEDMTTPEQQETPDIPVLDPDEKTETVELSPVTQQLTLPFEPEIQGDDDVATIAAEQSSENIDDKTDDAQKTPKPATGETNELLTQGLSFLSGLAKTLSSKEKTEQLVHSIVEKDETTGKTHLKIPVESEEIVSTALNLLGNLFKSFGK